VNGHPVLEAGTEERVHVRVGWASDSAMLMDREDALRSAECAAKRTLDGVAQEALRAVAVDGSEPVSGIVIDGQNEAEIDGASETEGVLTESRSYRRLIASKGAVALSNPVKVARPPVSQPLLSVGDVAHLGAGSGRVPVVARLDEEHLSAPRLVAP
jgi:hypothetical protein